MNGQEIVEMAMKSGCPRENAFVNFDILEEFAKLVAAKKREACAKLVEAFEPDDKDLAMAIRARDSE